MRRRTRHSLKMTMWYVRFVWLQHNALGGYSRCGGCVVLHIWPDKNAANFSSYNTPNYWCACALGCLPVRLLNNKTQRQSSPIQETMKASHRLCVSCGQRTAKAKWADNKASTHTPNTVGAGHMEHGENYKRIWLFLNNKTAMRRLYRKLAQSAPWLECGEHHRV